MTSQEVEFEVDGLTLRGRLFMPAAPKSIAVLFLHGWTGMTNLDAAELLAENGYPAMTFSLSGHNDSDGRIEDQTRDKSFKEALAAYDFFRSKVGQAAKIVAVGNSYGSYLSVMLMAKRRLAGVSLRVPANYEDDHSDEPQIRQGGDVKEVMMWRKRPLKPSENRALKNISEFSGPVQIIEAGQDERVPHRTVQNYEDAIADKEQLDYYFMKDWPHSLGEDKDRNRRFQKILLSWLDKSLF